VGSTFAQQAPRGAGAPNLCKEQKKAQ
jgi:hypothetical protein